MFWWYTNSFGYPQAKAQGKGWAQELVSRLTHSKSIQLHSAFRLLAFFCAIRAKLILARLTTFDSTTNSSFHDDVHFPLNDPLYVDFTHDSEFALRE
jgi:hypothetical protein